MRVQPKWCRRRFLRAAGIGTSIAAMAPFFPIPVAEAGGDPTRRLLLFMHPNGSLPDRWRANGAGPALRSGTALPRLQGPILAPLERHRSRLILLDGIDISSSLLAPIGDPGGDGQGHAARTVVWSGARLSRNPAFPAADPQRFVSNGPTIDQILAAGSPTRFPSLVLATSPLDRGSLSLFSFRSAGDPEVATADPRVTFDLVFGSLDGDPVSATRRRAERRSVLDVIRGDLGRLRVELPLQDRDRLDRHIESLRALEGRIGADAPTTCAVPARPGAGDSPVTILRLQTELATLALSCDLTRVISIAFGREGTTPSPLPAGEDIHVNSHESFSGASPASRTAALDVVTRYNRAVAEEFARVVDRLSESGTPSLLDGTVAVWGASMGWGGPHTNLNAPFILASGRTDLRTGYYHRWGTYETGVDGPGPMPSPRRAAGGIPHNRVLVSLLHAMGRTDIASVGDTGGGADLDNRPLAELFTS